MEGRQVPALVCGIKPVISAADNAGRRKDSIQKGPANP